MLHEIFHTLGFDNDGTNQGIGHGTTTEPLLVDEFDKKVGNFDDDIAKVVDGFIR